MNVQFKKFKNVQQIYDSRGLKWSINKIAKIYEYFKLNLDFPVDQRHSYHPSINLDDWSCQKTFA